MPSADVWLEKTLGYRFRQPELLARALTHRSAPGRSNERLEFLGDAILDLVVSEVVFRSFPNAAEGDLSRLRSSLVKDTSLARLARELEIGPQIALGGGEKKSGGQRRGSILADAVEALFGAVYLDGGFDAAREVVLKAYGERLENFPDFDDLRDPKTRLQEWLQARGRSLPVYELVRTSGKAHNQRFEVLASVDGDGGATSTGEGSSRRNAEQRAADGLLERLQAGES